MAFLASSLSALIPATFVTMSPPGHQGFPSLHVELWSSRSAIDDMAFAHFEKEKLLCTSKPQPGNRDYLIIGYEACEEVAQNSYPLLCSSNNYTCDGIRFNSFGDSHGRRKDMYRFTRIFDSEPHELAQFLDRAEDIEMLLSSDMESIASKCSSMVKKKSRMMCTGPI